MTILEGRKNIKEERLKLWWCWWILWYKKCIDTLTQEVWSMNLNFWTVPGIDLNFNYHDTWSVKNFIKTFEDLIFNILLNNLERLESIYTDDLPYIKDPAWWWWFIARALVSLLFNAWSILVQDVGLRGLVLIFFAPLNMRLRGSCGCYPTVHSGNRIRGSVSTDCT